ncbi:hypothetical protein [Salinisphaera aquimarina]|uniref:Lipoprotein n=1 Tax=Salinisphaera aquimarina TaxID=2094031 RepID=A0ABV7EKX6_9GAMM
MLRNVVMLMSLLLLAACNTGDLEPAADTNPPTAAGTTQATQATDSASQANNNDDDGDASSAPINQTVEQAIPTPVQGRWGLTPADCEPGRADAKGLLVIDATTLEFYESRGTLAAVAERDASRIRATFEFSGEGMTWTRDETLDAQDRGKTLIRREYGDDAAPGPFKYRRCPD